MNRTWIDVILRAAGEAELCAALVEAVRGYLPIALVRVCTLSLTESRVIVATAGDANGNLPIALARGVLTAAGASSVVFASAHLHVGEQWVNCFSHPIAGRSFPLVSEGELVGVIDIGSDMMPSELVDDLTLLAQVAALRVRSLRAVRDARSLRDYTTRLMDYTSALLVGLDRNWRITRVNRAVLELVSGRLDSLIGRDLRDVIPSSQRNRVLSALATAEAGQVASVQLTLPTARGPVRTAWTIGYVGSESGLLEAFVAMGSEFSRIDALEQRIASAERLATTGRMAASIVHELGSPLTSITVYGDFLAKALRERGDADHVKAERIVMAAERILRFSKELVQYSRPPTPTLGPVDVAEVVRDALALCEHLVKGPLVLQTDLQPVPRMLGTSGQVEQIVVNLVTNAIHAVGSAGTICVRVSPSAQWIALTVGDSGPGIPEAHRNKVFEPFYTTKVDGKGTGLGLAIVRAAVEQLGGRVDVSTSELGGAEFRVLLPSAANEEAERLEVR